MQNFGKIFQQNRRYVSSLREEIGKLKTREAEIHQKNMDISVLENEVKQLRDEGHVLTFILNNEPQFDLETYKMSNGNLAFYTGFPTYSHVLMCFDVLNYKTNKIDNGTLHTISDTSNSGRAIGRQRKLKK